VSRTIAAFLALGATFAVPCAAPAQHAPDPPAVGVVEVVKRPITETSEFLGRIEAINRVNVVARVTAFLEKRFFTEGAEVSANDQLYLLERGPFQADLDAKKAQVAQLEATLANAKLTTERQSILLWPCRSAGELRYGHLKSEEPGSPGASGRGPGQPFADQPRLHGYPFADRR